MLSLSADSIFLVTLCVAMLATYKTDKLTTPGIFVGGLMAIIIYMGVGYRGIALLGCFFFLAVLATSYKKAIKKNISAVEQHQQKRNAGQVFANGGAAAILGLAAIVFPAHAHLLLTLIAAAFAAATADTMSSELGTVYGKQFYNIINLKPDQRGRDGVVSLEGTAIGILGATAVAAIYSFGFGWGRYSVMIIIAGTVGNISDSILGATLERKGKLNNNAVNFLNTAIAALVYWLMIILL